MIQKNTMHPDLILFLAFPRLQVYTQLVLYDARVRIEEGPYHLEEVGFIFLLATVSL